MNTNTTMSNEYQSLRVILTTTNAYRTSSAQSQQIVRDIRHIITAYRLCDKETALACNRYITTKYPIIYKVAPRYGLHPMSQDEMLCCTDDELHHMLYNLCVFLYDRLRMQA